jgi:hypothetical protein
MQTWPFSDMCRQTTVVAVLPCSGNRRRQADTLVMYIYADSDPEYRRNLEFFVRFGVTAGPECDYIIVVQQVQRCTRCTQRLHGLAEAAADGQCACISSPTVLLVVSESCLEHCRMRASRSYRPCRSCPRMPIMSIIPTSESPPQQADS